MYPIGVERGWITRDQARERVLTTLELFANAPQGPDPTGVTGYKGFVYHFLDMETGLRHQTNELSTIDTTLLLAGAGTLFYFMVKALARIQMPQRRPPE